MPSHRALHILAAHAGILPSYVDQGGRVRRTSERTRIALLAALGIDASTEAAAGAALAAARDHVRQRILSPVRVADAVAARTLAAPGTTRGARRWRVDVACEDGARLRAEGRAGSDRLSIRLPPLPLGYHELQLTLAGNRVDRVAAQRLIVVPAHCATPHERLGPRRAYGILANLYTLRSARNWGVGDLSDLARLVDWAGDVGAAFVGVNPLHALDNRGDQISPYDPQSRLYRNTLYLDVTAAPEWRALPGPLRRRLERPAALQALRSADQVDYAAVRALKEPAFTALYRAFVADRGGGATARRRAHARYVAAEGEALIRFATFRALQEHFERRGIAAWTSWPAPYRDPHSAAVTAFRAAASEAIDRHCFLQFELERQLGAAARRAGRMPIGVYQDLALGSSRRGSDPWAYPNLFLSGVDIGAPPDDYSPSGQNWRLPPIDPRQLTASGYDYWIRLLRGAMRHAGALRIDHVMGLFRQYWIPAGASGADGAYVRFPAHDMLGILALESQRAGALVIGEDLGTVPRGLPAVLARWGILSTRVLYFERNAGGGFRAARRYLARALVGANTHDLPTLAGFWAGRDLSLRRRLGVLPDARALARAEAVRARDRRALVRRLRAEGILSAADPAPAGAALTAAVHAFLARTPAVLVGVSLDDLAGEETSVNQPGVSLARYPSWSRRMRLSVEAFAADAAVAQSLDGLPSGSRRVRRR